MASFGSSESQRSTVKIKKFKLPRKRLLDDFDAVAHASVPRKMRSAIRKRGSESPKIQNDVGTLRKNIAKKFKLTMTQEQISKDEKEVAETLVALAAMFTDETKTDKPGLDCESTVEVTVGAACHLSNLLHKDRLAKFISSNESTKHELDACTSSLSFTATKSSETEKSCPRRNCATQHSVTEESAKENKIQLPLAEPKKCRRSSIHVYISQLIKVWQTSERGEQSLEQLTLMTGGDGNFIMPQAADQNLAQIQNLNLFHGTLLHEQQGALKTSSSNVLSLKTLLHEQQRHLQGSNVLSLATECRGLDAQQHVQFPPFLSSSMVPTGRRWDSPELNWTVPPSPVRNRTAGERESTNLTKYLPDLLSNIDSKQQFPQPQFTAISLPYSNAKTAYNPRFQLGFQADRDIWYPDLQVLCNRKHH